jgi:DNA-binding transcriptional LysR family regulator
MNIHHLELFYYVGRHGGIMEAVRNIPYGIQQPAVSGQVAQLEEYLGTTLFQRRPFALTPSGKKLYQFIEPFFSHLDVLAADLQGGRARSVRIGASTIVLRDHLPALFRNVRKKFPSLKIALREGYQAELEAMLDADAIDLAVTLIEKKSAPGIHSLAMLEVPLALLVEKSSAVTSLDQLWGRDKIEEPLICLPEVERICKSFQQGLARIGVDWFPGIEASSIDIIETYVSSGFGIGLSVLVPKTVLPENIRALPLPKADFAPVVVGALWRGKASSLVQAFLDEMQAAARRLS